MLMRVFELHEDNTEVDVSGLFKPPGFTSTNKDRLVYISGGRDWTVERIFLERGYTITQDIEECTICVFTGGQDIGPYLYGEEPLNTTRFSRERDAQEVHDYNRLGDHVLKLGICRGGQLLNVLSGGSMFQHVNNHHGTHWMTDYRSGELIKTSSIHHQMMRPSDKAEIICDADISTYRMTEKETLKRGEHYPAYSDPEVVWYEHTKSLCFQGHPEYGPNECTEYFFSLVDDFYPSH